MSTVMRSGSRSWSQVQVDLLPGARPIVAATRCYLLLCQRSKQVLSLSRISSWLPNLQLLLKIMKVDMERCLCKPNSAILGETTFKRLVVSGIRVLTTTMLSSVTGSIHPMLDSTLTRTTSEAHMCPITMSKKWLYQLWSGYSEKALTIYLRVLSHSSKPMSGTG